MAQKVNPIAVRLNFNRFSDSSWFSDYYYSSLLYQDIITRQYLTSMKEPKANKLGVRIGKCIIHHYPKRSLFHVFCLSELRTNSFASSKIDNLRKKVVPSGFTPTLGRSSHVPLLSESVGNGWTIPMNKVDSNLSEIRTALSQKKVSYSFSWLDSKTTQKKRALIFLSRHVAGNFLQKTLKAWKKNFEKKNFEYRISSNEQSKKQLFSLFSPEEKKQRISFLDFYALSFFFLHKVNFTFCGRDFILGLDSKSEMAKDTKIHNLFTKQNIHTLFLNWKFIRNHIGQNQSGYSEKQTVSTLVQDLEMVNTMVNTLPKSALAHSRYVPLTKSIDFYFSNIYASLSQSFQSHLIFNPIKVSNVYQSASLLAQEIACRLEQKKAFRLICRTIFQQNSSYNNIKGIRITCSGRLNGAEIAKTECKKFGETSLHVFSEKMDYAFAKASTSYGILGVKVWISYF